MNWSIAFSVVASVVSAVSFWAANDSAYSVQFALLGAAALLVTGWLAYAGGRRDSKADSEKLSHDLQRAFTQIDEARRISTDPAITQQLADTEAELLPSAVRWASNFRASRQVKALSRRQRLRADEQKAGQNLRPARDVFQSAIDILQDNLKAYNAGSERPIEFDLTPLPANISDGKWKGMVAFGLAAKWQLQLFTDRPTSQLFL